MASEWVLRIAEERPPPMGLGIRIRQQHKEAGWSQADLGDKIGTDSQRVSRYEKQRIAPSLDAIVRVAEAFSVSIDYLLVDDISRRPLHSVEHNLGDHLAHVGELSSEDLDGLVAKARLKALAGGIS